MSINKLDLLAKGWNTAEIEHASKILEEAEDRKPKKKRLFDGLILLFLGLLMIANGFACSALLVPFIYALQLEFVLVLAAIIGVIFSVLFTLIIYDVENIHKKHETNLFIAFIVNGIVDFYLILEFTAQFSVRTKLPPTHNIYLIAGTYLIAFLLPQIVYQMKKKT
jgi:uncharacterized membrane protein